LVVLLLLVAICGVLLAAQLMRLSASIRSIGGELTATNIALVEQELDQFFGPTEQSLRLAHGRGVAGLYEGLDDARFLALFAPMLRHHLPVSSMLLGDTDGNERMILELGGEHYTLRTTTPLGDSTTHGHTEWSMLGDSVRELRRWNEPQRYDTRDRPWFLGALAHPDQDTYWTAPYQLFTTHEPGITAARSWHDRHGVTHVIAYDVLLADLCRYLYLMEPSPRGRVFVLTSDDRMLGHSGGARSASDSLMRQALEALEDMDLPEVEEARSHWARNGRTAESFTFRLDEETWYAGMLPYALGENTFHIGVLVPGSDLLDQVKHTRRWLIAGIMALGLVTLLVLRLYRQRVEAFEAVGMREEQVDQQRRQLYEGLRYAQGLQEAVLPTAAAVREHLPESFVILQPKDLVTGDLYWVERMGDRILFAVADCTGHGVPGALVSMVCLNALQRSVRERSMTDPGHLLDRVNEQVHRTFAQGGHAVRDGMDICLCRLDPLSGAEGAVARLAWAGAKHPLWIIRAGSARVEEHRSDRFSIGQGPGDQHFSTFHTDLFEGDQLYCFTDGMVDQFGGPQGKKLRAKGLQEFLLAQRALPMDQQGTALGRELEKWRGMLDQVDDSCIMGVRITRDRGLPPLA
jgi:serine phosphatase RsbU (regulator of sigma subunit)